MQQGGQGEQGGAGASAGESSQSRCWKMLFLKKWHPQPTVQSTKYLFFIVGVIFIIFGVVINIFNSRIKENEIQNYEQQCTTETCTIPFTLQEDFNDTAYLFYGLDNFYQNHRRYIKSKSSSQLSGNVISMSDANTYCSPIVRNKDLQLSPMVAFDKVTPLDPEAIATPCGLIARSFFTDTYQLFHTNADGSRGAQVVINENGIAWPDDIGNKFRLDESRKSQYWHNVQDEHFIVWMRTSGLPNFRKLWGIINEQLKKGAYQFEVANTYNVAEFKGHKNIILSTSGPFGGKNYFLSISFIVVGSISVLIALAFFIKQRTTDNKFGAPTHQE